MADNRKVKVYCKTLGKWFKTIGAAAKFAKVNDWTMSRKMETAGCFIDNEGNEYIRSKPMKTKNEYKSTGTTLKRRVKTYIPRPNRKKNITEQPVEKKTVKKANKEIVVFSDLPKPVQEFIVKSINDMFREDRPWSEIKKFMLDMGCKKLTLNLESENEK